MLRTLFPWKRLQLLIILNSSMRDRPTFTPRHNQPLGGTPNRSGMATTTVTPSKDAEPHSLNSPRFG